MEPRDAGEQVRRVKALHGQILLHRTQPVRDEGVPRRRGNLGPVGPKGQQMVGRLSQDVQRPQLG